MIRQYLMGSGEIAGCDRDARLGKRLSSLLQGLGGNIGGTMPFACQDWVNTKAAYRLLSNDDVDEHAVLAGHFQATRDRAHGPLLISKTPPNSRTRGTSRN